MDDKPNNEEPAEDPKLESAEDPQEESNEEPKVEPKKEPKKEFNKLDLTQLESFSFGTEWSKEKAESGSNERRRDDRPRRDGPRDDRKDRRGFKRSQSPVSGGGDGRERRGGGGDRRGQGGPGRPREDGPRGERWGGAAVPLGPYISPYFDATFYPEDVSFAALAKTIRASARTFELFDIAKTVIGKHDRFVVVLERKSGAAKTGAESPKPFQVCLLDGLPFESEEAVMNHITQKHLERFFEISEQESEPPKGSFQVINRCGVTGELLGPPNYHLYNQSVQQHHATRLAHMDFERFSSRIETVRDPEVVEQWLQSMKTVTRYSWRGDEIVPLAPTATGVEPAAAADVSAAPVESTPADPALAESAATEDDTSVPPDAPAVEDASPADPADEIAPAELSDEPAEVVTEATEGSPAESEISKTKAEPSFDSVNEAKVYLITHARDKCVRTYESGRFHGRALNDLPDGEIKRAVLGALERQQRFPLDTANALRGRLRREGFTIFKKGAKGISYVSAVKRKFRGPGQNFADSIDALITFVEKNPMVKVSELTEKFLGIAPAEAGTQESASPTATAPGTVSPFGEADQPRIRRMQLDLRWLVTEGYVTEFIDGSLFASPPLPAPKKVEAAKPATPAPKAPEQSVADEPPVPAAPDAGEDQPAQGAVDPDPAPADPVPASVPEASLVENDPPESPAASEPPSPRPAEPAAAVEPPEPTESVEPAPSSAPAPASEDSDDAETKPEK